MFKKVALLASVALGFGLPAVAQDSFGAPQQQMPQQQQGYPAQQQQGYPAQQGYPQQQQVPQQQGGGQQGAVDQLTQMERQDFGIAPTAQLHSGAMHSPTPTSIPGGQVITTKGVLELMQGRQVPFFLFDVLGAQQIIPGALAAVPAHQAGSFNDQTQQEFGGFLQQTTQGRKDPALIFYCASTQCWMSYNAALRAINMGYTNVLWYRGGIDAWQAAGQQVMTPYQTNMPPNGPQPGQGQGAPY